MSIKIKRRKVADKTRETILKVARRIFAKNGFSATTTQAIAQAAKVNEALIFHHFFNKAKLWQAVKSDVIENISFEPIDPEPSSLHDFLKSAIQQRLFVYENNPELIRLIQWQQLEAKQEKLFAGNKLAPKNWLGPIGYLQKTGKIKKEIQPEFIMLWLTASINLIIFDQIRFFELKENKDKFLKLILDSFLQVLA